MSKVSSENNVIVVLWIEPCVDDAGREIHEIVDLLEFDATPEGQQCASAQAARWLREASGPWCVEIVPGAQALATY